MENVLQRLDFYAGACQAFHEKFMDILSIHAQALQKYQGHIDASASGAPFTSQILWQHQRKLFTIWREDL
jgi:hypothetical protein